MLLTLLSYMQVIVLSKPQNHRHYSCRHPNREFFYTTNNKKGKNKINQNNGRNFEAGYILAVDGPLMIAQQQKTVVSLNVGNHVVTVKVPTIIRPSLSFLNTHGKNRFSVHP